MKNKVCSALIALVILLAFSAPSQAETKEACGAKMCKECISLCTKQLASFKKKGGKYATAERIQLMNDCIAACKKREKDSSAEAAKACADICNKCAASCEELRDPDLNECINSCKRCAQVCTE